jgi:radical SAM protein with 4Fe4S-binding SPASM domain
LTGFKKDIQNMKFRFETFGGIIASDDPPFLAFVDRNYMRELDLVESPLWTGEDESIGRLTAPVEVHFAMTNRCSGGCPHCYMDAGEQDTGELDTPAVKRALDILAGMKVFHVALGGGEALERPDWLEIAEYARKIGLVPNLTVSGLHITPEIADKMKVFGQVNVSIDGIDEMYAVFRGKNLFEIADRAIDLLIASGVPTGINCVIGGPNFESIPDLFAYAEQKGMNEIEFLRFKPSGRGKTDYESNKISYKQSVRLIPLLTEMSEKHGMMTKIDCSFVPMLCYHYPEHELLEALATYGCEAGNVLLGMRSDGTVAGCSFLKSPGLSIFDRDFNAKGHFDNIIDWYHQAPEPCRSCGYLDICKGGCHAVAEYVTGNMGNPDPNCPFVIEYVKKKAE